MQKGRSWVGLRPLLGRSWGDLGGVWGGLGGDFGVFLEHFEGFLNIIITAVEHNKK